MRIIVDTNIVFSAVVNQNSKIAELLLNPVSDLEFYSVDFLKKELFGYYSKLQKASKLSNDKLNESIKKILESIYFISEDIIKNQTWQQAYDLIKEIDEDDTPFVALALELKGLLWTGDMSLIKGTRKIGLEICISTKELYEISDK